MNDQVSWTERRVVLDPPWPAFMPQQTIQHMDSKDISTEIRRTYTWESGATVTIEAPKMLIVSKNGHRIADGDNNGHYIPKGWIHLHWINKPGAPAIVA